MPCTDFNIHALDRHERRRLAHPRCTLIATPAVAPPHQMKDAGPAEHWETPYTADIARAELVFRVSHNYLEAPVILEERVLLHAEFHGPRN